jgi:hypothetical protein
MKQRNLVRGLVCLLISLTSSTLTESFAAPGRSAGLEEKRIFVFHTNEFWLNLHHFLYVLGRAENKEQNALGKAVANAPKDQERGLATLKAKEKTAWREAVSAYASGPSKKDLVFDDPMPATTAALASAADSKSLVGVKVDSAIAAALEKAAPVYKKVWWKDHQQANRDWQKSMEKLVSLHGSSVLSFITNAYKVQWPSTGFHVHVSGYSNWAGAYSTTGDLLVLSSKNEGTQAVYGLETIFHEGMHQWDELVTELLRAQAKKVNKLFSRRLSHALIFFTAGEAVRRVVPGHVPYAEKFGVWQSGLEPLRVALEAVWKPYLEGTGTRDEALMEVIKRTGVEPPKQ